MRISRDNIDEYYKKVNDKIDVYFGKGVDPVALKRYFKKGGYGISRFIEREGFSDIEGIDRVITDCVEDRLTMNENCIKTFENFNTGKKFNTYFDMEYPDVVEKILADHYKVSLGHVKLDGNYTNIEGIGINKEVYVFRDMDMKEILDDFADDLLLRIVEKPFKYYDKEYDISLFIDETEFRVEFHENEENDINSYVEKALEINTGDKYKFIGEKNEIYIFEKMS